MLFIVAGLETKFLIRALGSQTLKKSVLLSNTSCNRGLDTYSPNHTKANDVQASSYVTVLENIFQAHKSS